MCDKLPECLRMSLRCLVNIRTWPFRDVCRRPRYSLPPSLLDIYGRISQNEVFGDMAENAQLREERGSD
jgi:hypothetical protein